MNLFIDACVRNDSRTRKLADAVLSNLGGEIQTLRLQEVLFPVSDESFLQKRDGLIAEGRFDDPLFQMAHQFSNAENIVIAAPYWDLSFPSSLKQYIEQINVLGITFRYTADGRPEGLCRAEALYYVMTSGGTFCPDEFGYGYIEALAKNFYGIPKTRLISATGLDIFGADLDSLLQEAIESVKEKMR